MLLLLSPDLLTLLPPAIVLAHTHTHIHTISLSLSLSLLHSTNFSNTRSHAVDYILAVGGADDSAKHCLDCVIVLREKKKRKMKKCSKVTFMELDIVGRVTVC
jgi:hypothetical protein